MLHLGGATVVVCVSADAAETLPREGDWAIPVPFWQLDVFSLLLLLDWKLVFWIEIFKAVISFQISDIKPGLPLLKGAVVVPSS